MYVQDRQCCAEDRMSIAGKNAYSKFPEHKCIYQLFQEQANRTPDRIAVVSAEDCITYKELDEKSNQFGRYLQSKGVRPETLVGICLDRSINMIVGILSILKAGGAYVPVDSNYPADRIAFMLEDSAAGILVTQTSLQSKLPETNAEIVCIDSISDELKQVSTTPLVSDVKSNNLAYVIYTSGSTGRPKGVMIENRNVVRLLFNDHFQFDFSENDVWSIFHSFCFDFSVWEMYGALLFGGKAVIITHEATRDPHAFTELILQQKVTVINQTPSAFYALIPYLIEVSDQVSFLRYVIFGGEKLSPFKLSEIKSIYSQVKFVNMYGITETTVHVTYKEITDKEIAEGFSNIGKPIPTLKVYIFDENMQLAPIGVEGELCVGGHGVARGYLNRDALTKEKFIPNPLNSDEIIYKSGDLACVQKNGDLEYFGRMDNQVQLRGFRIELGEIESVITGFEEIKDCFAAIDEVANGDNRIIAYFIPARNEISINELKEKTEKKLPGYMIPSFFIEVDEFPLTDNGKLDLKKLPSPDIDSMSNVNHSAPENETERIMTEIWSDVLGIEKNKLGREYNFFDIGGHSLTAVMILGIIREKFKKEVTIRHIYANPKLSDLCRVMMQLGEITERSLTGGQNEIKPDSIYPIKSTQLAYWLGAFLTKFEISNVCEIYSLDGVFDFDAFQKALNKVAVCHESLWCPFSKKRPLTHSAEPGTCTVEYIDCNEINEDEKHNRLDDLIVEILHKPFDLSQVPLFRMTVIKKDAKKHILLVSFPHIISDVASVNIFVHDIFDACRPSRTNERAAYQLRKTGTREIIDSEIRYFESSEYTGDKEYWQEKLEGLDLLKVNRKYLFPRKRRNQPGRKQITKIKLDESTIDALQRLSAQSNTSIQIILQAIVHATLYTLSEQDDIATMMVYDMSGMYPYPPEMQLNATMILVVSKFTNKSRYIDLISNLKAFLVESIDHVRLPDLILAGIPFFSAMKHRPWLSGFLKAVGRFYSWYYRKSMVNKDVIISYIFAILGMVLTLRQKNAGRKKKDWFRYLSVVFNVLPSFYESRKIWSNELLSVTAVGDRELVMDPRVFEERSNFQDAKPLNFDLLRDSNGQAYLYIWGGTFTPSAFDCMKEIFLKHLDSILDDPTQPVQTGQI